MKNTVFLLVTVLVLSSCKENKNEKQINEKSLDKTQVQVDDNKDNFTLAINAIVEKDDEFTLYYLEEGQKAIKKKNSISLQVEGAQDIQLLKFQLKNDILPIKLFLKFGKSQKDQKITFFETKVTYQEGELVIEGSRFFQFFNPNEFIEFDKENNTAIVKEIKGKLNPTFISRKVLDQKIDFFY